MMPRPARLWHVPKLVRILWAFERATPWLPRVRSRRTDLHTMARVVRRGWVRVIGDPRRPRGFIARDGERLHALYVHPKARGQGIGSRLLAEAKAHSPRLELWTPEANAPARAFYQRHGFAEQRRTSGEGNDENLPDILFVWQRKEAT